MRNRQLLALSAITAITLVFLTQMAGSEQSAKLSPHFRRAWWCAGPNAQTIWAALLRPAPRIATHRERWETPDGDFLDVDRLDGPAGSPILVVLHGLEGSSMAKSVLGLLRKAHQSGWQGLAMNFRSCSGEPNRLRRSYHGGETSDLAWVIDRLIKENPDRPIFCAGFSLGGNVLLKYLGERGDSLPQQVRAAVAISAPFDLAVSARGLEQGFSKRYSRRIVAGLRKKTLEKLSLYPDLVNREALSKVTTLEQFDNLVTAPVHGFKNANDYWAASSSLQFLSKIRRPTLLINALDDPFFPGKLLPVKEVSENRFLSALFPEHGGHVGFLSGLIPGLPWAWDEKEAIRFLESILTQEIPPSG